MGTLSPDLTDKYPIYRLITEGRQQLTEVLKWDLPTIMEVNEFLDFKADLQTANTMATTLKKKG